MSITRTIAGWLNIFLIRWYFQINSSSILKMMEEPRFRQLTFQEILSLNKSWSQDSRLFPRGQSLKSALLPFISDLAWQRILQPTTHIPEEFVPSQWVLQSNFDTSRTSLYFLVHQNFELDKLLGSHFQTIVFMYFGRRSSLFLDLLKPEGLTPHKVQSPKWSVYFQTRDPFLPNTTDWDHGGAQVILSEQTILSSNKPLAKPPFNNVYESLVNALELKNG